MEIKVSEELNFIIRYAGDEAMRTGYYAIGHDHLFLGIIRHGDNDACRVLLTDDQRAVFWESIRTISKGS